MSPGRGKKNVRFPDEHSLSQSRDASPPTDDEPDYFSLRRADEDDEDDESDNEVRAQTRTNTWQNRNSTTVPGFSVTPPPEQAMAQGVFGDFGDLGNAGGLAPGAQSHTVHDPDGDELEARRQRLLSSLTPEQRRMANHSFSSTPASPGEGPSGTQGEAIPLRTLVSGVEQRLEELHIGTGHARTGSNFSTASPVDAPSREDSSDKTLNEKEEKAGVKFKEGEAEGKDAPEAPGDDLEGVKSPDTTRIQAEEIARQLVKVHGIHTGKKPENDGFVVNPNYLEKAVGFDNEAEVNPEDAELRENDAAMEMEVGGKLADEELPPERVREGILGSLLRLYAERDADMKSQASLATSGSGYTPLTTPGGSPMHSPSESPHMLSRAGSRDDISTMSTLVDPRSGKKKGGALRPPAFMRATSAEDVLGRSTKDRRQWYEKQKDKSKGSASAGFAALAANSLSAGGSPMEEPTPKSKKKKNFIPLPHEHYAKQQAKKKRRAQLEAEQARITIHIADLLQRQRFILRFGRALMLFGAPSHRLEEYLRVTARTLEIDAQFLYMPGCMLVSFGDATTHTSETKLLKVAQGLNLTKLDATHLVFKEVVHGLMEIEEAGTHIDQLLQGKNQYPAWMTILFFGLATGFLCLFAFGGWWTDLPIAVLLGSSVGFLQIWVAPRSDLYANVFEVTAAVLISFVGRALGSIRPSKPIFCFGAIVQGALALILPGYIILCGSLELQSKNLVAGAVRMFYAIIYSTFLSFGITLGSAVYGWIDGSAVTTTSCNSYTAIDDRFKILFVPLSAAFMSLVNQASYRQLPTMVLIASAGYTVLYFVQAKIADASSFTSALGALTIGLLGNLYSRVGHGLAFAAMLPGIFVIVPSGVAVQGSLISGLSLAETITNKNSSSSSTSSSSVTDLGGTMTQVAVGITVGLFVATLVVYPLGTGTKRSGLFTF